MRRLLMIGLFLVLLVVSIPQPVRASAEVSDIIPSNWDVYLVDDLVTGFDAYWFYCTGSIEPYHLPTQPSFRITQQYPGTSWMLRSARLMNMTVTFTRLGPASPGLDEVQPNETLDFKCESILLKGLKAIADNVCNGATYTFNGSSVEMSPQESGEIEGTDFDIYLRRGHLNYSQPFGFLEVDIGISFCWNVTWRGYEPTDRDMGNDAPPFYDMPPVPDLPFNWPLSPAENVLLFFTGIALALAYSNYMSMRRHTEKERILKKLTDQRKQVQEIAIKSTEIISNAQRRIEDCNDLIAKIDMDIARRRRND